MRVLHTMSAFSPLSETFIYRLVLDVSLRTTETLVVARERANDAERPFDSVHLLTAHESVGVKQYFIDALRRITPGALSDRHWRGYRRSLEAVAREFRPDVIHAHFGPEGVFAAPVASDLRVPMLTSFHGFDASMLLRSRGWRKRFRALWRGRNAVTAVSHAMRDALIRSGCPAHRAHVLRTGVPRATAHASRRRSSSPALFISIGRFVEKKGHLDAIRAMERVMASGSSVSLRIIGDGPLLEEAREYVAARGLAGRVQLMGALDHARTLNEMSNADAFILCSRTASNGDQEGVPVVLMEAQALGLPCVSTRHAGIPEVIPASNHWLLAPEGDVDAIAAVIARLRAASPDMMARICDAGATHVREHFDTGTESDRLVAHYRDMARSG